MRILYGVVGEGMGHATRSRVVIEHLLRCGHELLIVVSGRAHGFLTRTLGDRPADAPGRVELREIHGLSLAYQDGAVDKSASVWKNLEEGPEGIIQNVEVYASVVGRFDAELVVSDFESWAWLFARLHDLPVVSIDNMQVINRCRHEEALVAGITGLPSFQWQLTRGLVKMKLPGAFHYLITSFFFPPVRKGRTTLVPPILRPEILAARREPGAHLLVYQTSGSDLELLRTLSDLGVESRVYGMGEERPDWLGAHVALRPFSQDGFIDDLRTARAVVAGGGFSLMGEAVHLGVPMLSIPLQSQFEQELNARYLAQLGYGAQASAPSVEAIEGLLQASDRYQSALEAYPRQGNELLFGCVDELVERARLGEPAPESLDAPSMGDRVQSEIDATIRA